MTTKYAPSGDIKTAPMWLVYEDSRGWLHHQDHSLVVDQGTLTDPHTGEDMQIVGWVHELPDRTLREVEDFIDLMGKVNAKRDAEFHETYDSMSFEERQEVSYMRGLERGWHGAYNHIIESLTRIVERAK